MHARDGKGEDRERYGGSVLAAIRPRALGSLNSLTLLTGSRLSAICILSHARFGNLLKCSPYESEEISKHLRYFHSYIWLIYLSVIHLFIF